MFASAASRFPARLRSGLVVTIQTAPVIPASITRGRSACPKKRAPRARSMAFAQVVAEQPLPDEGVDVQVDDLTRAVELRSRLRDAESVCTSAFAFGPCT